MSKYAPILKKELDAYLKKLDFQEAITSIIEKRMKSVANLLQLAKIAHIASYLAIFFSFKMNSPPVYLIIPLVVLFDLVKHFTETRAHFKSEIELLSIRTGLKSIVLSKSMTKSATQ